MVEETARSEVSEASLDLERDLFLRKLVRELAGTLEDVVGVEEAAGFVSVVGERIGDWIGESYTSALDRTQLSRAEVAEVLVDLKARIKGDFYVIEQDDDRIVLGNNRCPFGEAVKGRRSMCMMTSNVFGRISSNHLGYAKVELQETIAEGDPGCRVIVHLTRDQVTTAAPGREYFRGTSVV